MHSPLDIDLGEIERFGQGSRGDLTNVGENEQNHSNRAQNGRAGHTMFTAHDRRLGSGIGKNEK